MRPGPDDLGKKYPSVFVVIVAVVGFHDRRAMLAVVRGKKWVCRMVSASVRGHHPHKP